LGKSEKHIKVPGNTDPPDLLTKAFGSQFFLREGVEGLDPWCSMQPQVHIQGPAYQY